MLATMTKETTRHEPMSDDGMSDAAIQAAVDDFKCTIRAGGQHFNETHLWGTARDLQQQPEITGDAFIVALAIASLTKVPRYGCRATHKMIADRATAIKKFFAVAQRVGWPRIMTVLGIGA
jgi:hypothetical protein